MNIFHINSNYLSTTLHENLIDYLASENVYSYIYTPRKKETIPVFNSKYDIFSPEILTNMDRFFYLRKQNKLYSEIVNNVALEEFNIIHAHTLFTDGNLARTLSEENEIPYMVTIRSTDLYFLKYRKLLLKKGINILKNASKIIFLSSSYKENIIKSYIPNKLQESIRDKSYVIPNGIDDFWFDRKNLQKQNYSEKDIQIVYAGRIEKNKNLILTAKALEYLNKTSSRNYKYTVVGNIKDENIYQGMLKYNFIEFKGHLKKDDLKEVYNSADIYVMPSFFESFGLTYAEAMSQGLPVIYTEGQGFDGQFKNGDVGYSTNPNDYLDLAKKISWILKDYKNFSNRALEGSAKFNWGLIGARYLDLYKEIHQFQRRDN